MFTAISDEQVLETPVLNGQVLFENYLASVTEHCIIVRTRAEHAHIPVPLARISSLKKIETSRPGFLAIAAGLLLIAAAAQTSKDGGGASIPALLFGIGSVLAYVVSRRSALAFIVDGERTETVFGEPKEVSALIAAIQSASEFNS